MNKEQATQIGKRICNLRKSLNMTQEDLAIKVGYKSRSSINKIELGQNDITQSTLKRIAEALYTSVSYLMDGNEDDETIVNEFAEKLNQTLEDLKMSSAELSRITGINEATISNYRKGKYIPKRKNLTLICNALNIDVFSLYTFDQASKALEDLMNSRHSVPVLGYVRAGIPIEAVEEVLDYEEITPEMASQGEYFGLQIKGDSMEPKFSEGDVVIVRKQASVDNGDIAVVLVNGQDAAVKKFYRSEAGVQLISTNPAYPPLLFSPTEVDSKPVTVIGKVVELRAKF